jgi:hypothetical protein
MLAEQGLMGLAAFLYLLIAAMSLSWKLYKEAGDEFYKGIGFGFGLSVFSLMITNFFGDRWSYLSMGAYFWAFMGIMTRAYMINHAELAAAEEHEELPMPSLFRLVCNPSPLVGEGMDEGGVRASSSHKPPSPQSSPTRGEEEM